MDIDQKNLLPDKKIEVTLKQDVYFDKSDKNINVLTFRQSKQSFFFLLQKRARGIGSLRYSRFYCY